MKSTPQETATPAAEPTDQPTRERVTDYDRLVNDLAYTCEGTFSREACTTSSIPATLLGWDVAEPNDQPIDRVRDIRDDVQPASPHYCVTSTSDQGAAHGRQAVRPVRLCP